MLGDCAHPQQAVGWFQARHEALMFVVTCMVWYWDNGDTSQGDVAFAGEGQEKSLGRD